jgi:hypothetical protein
MYRTPVRYSIHYLCNVNNTPSSDSWCCFSLTYFTLELFDYPQTLWNIKQTKRVDERRPSQIVLALVVYSVTAKTIATVSVSDRCYMRKINKEKSVVFVFLGLNAWDLNRESGRCFFKIVPRPGFSNSCLNYWTQICRAAKAIRLLAE